MTIDDKILFLRAGYSKEEIESFETQATAPEAEKQATAPEAEKQATAPEAEKQVTAPEAEKQATAPEAEKQATAPTWALALQASIEKLVKVTQQGNIMSDDMGDAENTATSAEKALAKYLTGK